MSHRTAGQPPPTATSTTRDFTVAVFVVHRDRVLLHRHARLGRWLPPGGHIEPHELPDDAARREVLEEAGIEIELTGDRGLPEDFPGQPRQLLRPEGIQLEAIAPGHEHVDLVYFARPAGVARDGVLPSVTSGFQWSARDELDGLAVTDEIRAWCARALAKIGESP